MNRRNFLIATSAAVAALSAAQQNAAQQAESTRADSRKVLPPKPGGGAIEFELNGLRYQTLTRAGITIMFAQTTSVVRNYNMMQVAVANGSKRSFEIKPGDFAFVDTAQTRYVPMSPSGIVREFMDRADRSDVVKLVVAYEQTLYGMTRTSPTSGYERRRQAMLGEFQDPRIRAGATASAIVFVATKLSAGESTDGALFFKTTQNRVLGAGKLLVSTTVGNFEFDTYANPADPNSSK